MRQYMIYYIRSDRGAGIRPVVANSESAVIAHMRKVCEDSGLEAGRLVDLGEVIDHVACEETGVSTRECECSVHASEHE